MLFRSSTNSARKRARSSSNQHECIRANSSRGSSNENADVAFAHKARSGLPNSAGGFSAVEVAMFETLLSKG